LCVYRDIVEAGEMWVGGDVGEGAGVPGEQADASHWETASRGRQQTGHTRTGVTHSPHLPALFLSYVQTPLLMSY